MTPVAVPAAAVAAFVAGGAYYAALGSRLATVSAAAARAEQPPWKLAAELARCVVLAAVVAWLAAEGGVVASTPTTSTAGACPSDCGGTQGG